MPASATQRVCRWVDVIIGAVLLATVLVFALRAQVVLFGVALVLLMVVMRGLLPSATTLQSELAEVV